MTIEEMKKNRTMDKYFQESFVQYVVEKNIGKEEIGLYDEDRNKIRKIYRGEEIKQDEWEQCILCFVVDKKGNFLVENKLNGEKDECSGHVKQGEVPTQAVIRELYEEYGIEIEEALGVKYLDNVKVSFEETNGKLQCFLYIYVLFRTRETPIKIDKREILNIESIPYNDFFNMFENNKIFPYISQYKPIIPKLKELCEKIYEGKESNELERE